MPVQTVRVRSERVRVQHTAESNRGYTLHRHQFPGQVRYQNPKPYQTTLNRWARPSSLSHNEYRAYPGRKTSHHSHCRKCSCRDRKSTRLNSSHVAISYAVFCLKKKNNTYTPPYDCTI